MIHFFVGTKAQFIKMAPVMIEMKNRGIACRYIDSGQHAGLTQSPRKVFGLDNPDLILHDQDVVAISSGILWSARLACSTLYKRRWLREKVFPGGGICLIHGDTMSTLLGALMARAAGLDVGHLEAGLRSFRLFDPFPEELIRMFCMRRCQLLFAPSAEAVGNLQRMRVAGEVVDTGGNTVVDALRLMESVPITVEIPPEPFALATCHRLETITRRGQLGRVVALLNRTAEKMPVLFVIHKPTQRYLEKFNLKATISAKVKLLGMQSYVDFSALLRRAQVVLADGGSIQEECAYLNKPCLVLRRHSERSDGLGLNARIWGFDDEVAEDFLNDTATFAPAMPSEWPRPSAKVVDALRPYSEVT